MKTVRMAAIAAFFLSGGVASAQDNGAALIELDTLEIFGEKFTRDYTDVFTSVGLATGEEIENFRLKDTRKAFNTMANVRWLREGGDAGFSIRGINSDGATAPESPTPTASVVIDGATQSLEATRRGSRGTWDLQQLEVLRGPQSTTQGRNALAGAVVIKTNDPVYDFQLKARGIAGEDERAEGAMVFNAPIVDNQMAFRVSGEWRRHENDINYTAPSNEPLGEDEYYNIRGKLLWEPDAIDGLTALFTIASTYDKPGSTSVNAPFFDRTYGTASPFTEFREMRNDNYIADLTYRINDYLTIQSVSAFMDSDLDISTAPSAAPDYERYDVRAGNDFTQDIRLLMGQTEDTFSGVIGAFYGDFQQSTDSVISASSFGGVVQDLTTEQQTEHFSIYADTRYRFYEDWSLLLGGRYIWETVSNESEGQSFGTPLTYDFEEDFGVLLPKIGLAYDFTPDKTIAFTAQRGYRSGFTETVSGLPNRIDPEYLWSYEVAYRQTAMQGRLTVGANAFYYDYTNQQLGIFDSSVFPSTYTVNAGQSHSYGAEIEGRYRFDNGLQIFGALGLLKTEFDELTFYDPVNDVNQNYAGNEFPEAPNVTFSFGGIYRHTSGFFAAADLSYTGGYYSNASISNDPQLELDSYVVVNASVGYEKGFFKVTAFADNLFDEQYLTSLSNGNDYGEPPTVAGIGDGRKFGVEMEAKF